VDFKAYFDLLFSFFDVHVWMAGGYGDADDDVACYGVDVMDGMV
jgi:hypothetical protein